MLKTAHQYAQTISFREMLLERKVLRLWPYATSSQDGWRRMLWTTKGQERGKPWTNPEGPQKNGASREDRLEDGSGGSDH